jgi:hypothetical protein
MKIGILGAGFVGKTFAQAVMRVGHTVMLSSRTPESDAMQQLSRELGVQVGTVAQTIAYSDVIACALRWEAIPEVMAQGNWAGKTIIDMSNRFEGGHSRSAGEDLAALAAGAQVVKALNTIGAEYYLTPTLSGQAATMFIAGDSGEAKALVRKLCEQLGFEVVDAGLLSASRLLESLAELWVHLVFRAGLGRKIAFKLLRKE